MHCEITDHHFNKFFVEMQLKKQNVKRDVGAQTSIPVCNPYTGIPVIPGIVFYEMILVRLQWLLI